MNFDGFGVPQKGRQPQNRSLLSEMTSGIESKKAPKRKKCPPHLKSSFRIRWWNDKNEGSCFCCGRMLHFDDAQVGHIRAHSQGGEWSAENCRLICSKCNTGMGAEDMREYMKKHYPERFKEMWPAEEVAEKKKSSPRKTVAVKKTKPSTNIFADIDAKATGTGRPAKNKGLFGNL